MASVEGRPMVVRVLDALRSGGCSPLAIAGGSPAVQRVASSAGVTFVPDDHPGHGPLGGLIAAMAWCPTELLVAVACDMPWLDADTVARLAEGPARDADVRVGVTTRAEPLCACWRVPAVVAQLGDAFSAGERAINRAWAGLRVETVAVAAQAARNVNSRRDLVESGDE